MSVTNQHFVPRLYLSRYNNNQKIIWVLNKSQSTIKDKSIKSTASDEFFYKFSVNDIEAIKKDNPLEEVHPDLLDDFFTHKIEPIFTRSLDNILNTYKEIQNQEKRILLNESDLPDLAKSIAYQYFRTRSFRNGIRSNFKAFLESTMADESVAEILNFFDERKVLEHAKEIFRRANELSEKLVRDYYWIVYENHTSIPFYTSDSPVVAWKHQGQNNWDIVLHDVGFEIEQYAFPLTDRLLLVLVKKEFGLNLYAHCRILPLSDENNVKFFNEGQLQSSFNQVLSSSNNFDMFNGLHARLPDDTTRVIQIT
ncbi:DUF4238 domain-containing protein [Brevibacillus centrosporus]|uniref:DUF4238 domain-containing protein n=1 Tax=Brevibacillus centrosporus TaxID=54910 RepID=UPI00114453B5|nr:DUF4238 domain-containing protein [Brevibacillus centrosporus]MEC2127864.1 DUF4238 domain-containing protein [Brevibacillus centrosporus]GED32107.1 hypothetical protein BCE02nite_32480 [Brevibacillus centrosporus]